jgi:hypothetical protein
VFSFSLHIESEIFLLWKKIKRDIIDVRKFSCEVPVILVRVLYNLIFAKNTQIPNLTEIRPVGAELYHADGQTDGQADTTKLIVVFSNFANAPKTACPRKLTAD